MTSSDLETAIAGIAGLSETILLTKRGANIGHAQLVFQSEEAANSALRELNRRSLSTKLWGIRVAPWIPQGLRVGSFHLPNFHFCFLDVRQTNSAETEAS